MDNSIAERIAKAIEATQCGEVTLFVYDGEICKIETRIRASAWTKGKGVDKQVGKPQSVG